MNLDSEVIILVSVAVKNSWIVLLFWMLMATSCADPCWGQGARVHLTVLFLIRAVTNTQTTAQNAKRET